MKEQPHGEGTARPLPAQRSPAGPGSSSVSPFVRPGPWEGGGRDESVTVKGVLLLHFFEMLFRGDLS